MISCDMMNFRLISICSQYASSGLGTSACDKYRIAVKRFNTFLYYNFKVKRFRTLWQKGIYTDLMLQL